MNALVGGPHAHSGNSISRTMVLVLVALMPATLFGFYEFGWPAVFLFLVTVAAAIAAESFSLALAGKPQKPFLLDGSAVVTGWIIAMTLPPWAPWWIGVVGSFIAIVLAKHAFGGLGQNVFNPAMIARTVLLISFPIEMTQFLTPQPMFTGSSPGFLEGLEITFAGHTAFDAVSSASLLGAIKTQLGLGVPVNEVVGGSLSLTAMALGIVPGSMGETSAVAILLGGILLLATRTITWHAPVAMIVTMAVLAGLFQAIDPGRYPGPAIHLVSGTFLFAAFFIATDYVTAPATGMGKLIFGAGVAALTFIIRTWASYPEGIGFAILLMNAAVPLIDHYVRPRIYGRTRSGEPIRYEET
ncbi:RnfABCDGE type electron transport complex subunit D [Rhodobium gokarnense]|uniref:Ion-translocating oxidoreductase complex subunit D n=1 Tax=Rhodobium gokarnense TaxID=364296 RepID=A0ABT3H965_9HYPH|nr:RnfABCDGE type electron transport complex subunit D [Rhodobium gokarnense]MCW2306933.1 electron transport complex protein RnfD [Rhodobium gokarnense]